MDLKMLQLVIYNLIIVVLQNIVWINNRGSISYDRYHFSIEF